MGLGGVCWSGSRTWCGCLGRGEHGALGMGIAAGVCRVSLGSLSRPRACLPDWLSSSLEQETLLCVCECVRVCAHAHYHVATTAQPDAPWAALPPPRVPRSLLALELTECHCRPQAHTDSLNTLVALHQLYQYTQKYYDEVGLVPGVGSQDTPSQTVVFMPHPSPSLPRSSMPWKRTLLPRRCSWPSACSKSLPLLRTKSPTSDLRPSVHPGHSARCPRLVLGGPLARGPVGMADLLFPQQRMYPSTWGLWRAHPRCPAVYCSDLLSNTAGRSGQHQLLHAPASGALHGEQFANVPYQAAWAAGAVGPSLPPAHQPSQMPWVWPRGA